MSGKMAMISTAFMTRMDVDDTDDDDVVVDDDLCVSKMFYDDINDVL